MLSGAVAGLFDSPNSSFCGSRLIQLNDNYLDINAAENFDEWAYHTASAIATSAFAFEKCYQATKESLISFVGFSDGMTWARVYRGYSWPEFMWLNMVWNASEMFESYRQVKKLLQFEMTWLT